MAIGSNYRGKFCSPDEIQIATIGLGYSANFLTGGAVEKTGATLTNKRVYFSGTIFSFGDKGNLSSTKELKIVNVRDITGTGYKRYSPIQYVAWAVIALISGIVAMVFSPIGEWGIGLGIFAFIVLLAIFLVYSKTLFLIEYAGGNIAFDTRWYRLDEQYNFIHNIHLVKDELYSMAADEEGFLSDIADEIPDL